MPVIRAAKVVIFDANNRALMLRRSDTHPRTPLRMDLPGGVIKDDETFEEGVCREVKEETGLDIDPSSLKLVYTHTYDFFGKSISRLLYVAHLSSAKPTIDISWEHSEYHWVENTSHLTGLESPYQQGVEYANENNLWTRE